MRVLYTVFKYLSGLVPLFYQLNEFTNFTLNLLQKSQVSIDYQTKECHNKSFSSQMKKILLSSDCNGNFELLFSKVAQLSQKTKFDLMFIVGNVCTIEASKQFSMIVKGEIKVPIPTYFITTGPMSKIFNLNYLDGCEIAPNFHFLGSKGLKNIHGLNVCYFNGTKSDKTLDRDYQGQNYDLKDIKSVIDQNKNQSVDILLTNQWPQEISKNSSSTIQNFHLSCSNSKLASLLSYQLSPKYHISASGKVFYRMEPFKNKRGSYTHFINVAEIIKDNLKDKYLLAIQTIPEFLNPPEEVISNSVNSPFDSSVYEKMQAKDIEPTKTSNQTTGFVNEQKRLSFKESLKLRKEKKQQGNSNYVNENSYVFFDGVPKDARTDDIHQFLQRWGQVTKLQVFTQYKGDFKSGIVKFATLQQIKSCLADSGKYSLYQNRIKFKLKNIQQKYRNEDCWFCEKNEKFDRSLLVYRGKYCIICLDKGPVADYHLQIVPLNHVDTLGKLESVQVEEIDMIKKQLRNYFEKNGYQTIITERYIKLSSEISHTLIQFIAVKQPQQLVHRFYQINHDQRLNFNKIGDESSWKRKSEFFIKFEVNRQTFIKEIYGKERVEIDQVRRFICELINKPAKVNWRSCQRNQKDLEKDRTNVENVLKECHLMIE